MKSFAQFIGFSLIILGGFWIGMQWGAVRPKTHMNPIIPEAPTKTPIIPVIVPAEPVSVEEVEKEKEETPVAPTVNTAIDPNLPKNTTDKLIRYDSSRFKYGFDMPANVYFSAFSGDSGALHTVGI